MQHGKNILKLSLNSDEASFMYSLVYFIQPVMPGDDDDDDDGDLHLSRNMLH